MAVNPFQQLIADVRQDWRLDALCAGLPNDMKNVFFPGNGQPAEPAKRICRQCPVQVECAEWAVRNGEKDGVWGGMSVEERAAIRYNRGPIKHGSKSGAAAHYARGEKPCEECRRARNRFMAARRKSDRVE